MPHDITRLTSIVDGAFEAGDNPLAETQAVLAIQNGEMVLERYGAEFDHTSTFISWSMAKSMTSVACGMLIADGRLSLDAPAPVAEWHAADADHDADPRAAITLRHLLQMRSGLEWVEDYVDDGVSDVIEMLGGANTDMAGYAINKPLDAAPGAEWKYSSGTTNIVTRIMSDVLSGGDTTDPDTREQDMRAFLQQRLFGPLGMDSAEPKFDGAGTWVGSSFVYATARDFAKFGQFFLDGGRSPSGEQLVTPEWVAESVTTHATDPESGQGYGLQWWTGPGSTGMYSCNGYEGQRIQISPQTATVMVRLGKTSDDHGDQLREFYASVMGCFSAG